MHVHLLTINSVPIPDGGNPLTQEEQSEYLLWKNVFSAVRHGRRNEVQLAVFEIVAPSNISSGHFIA
jgi:hypothetical protein